jgi:hypothetical protein
MHRGWWDALLQQVNSMPVPGEGLYWNCQDYVIEIWDGFLAMRAISQKTYNKGKGEGETKGGIEGMDGQVGFKLTGHYAKLVTVSTD